MPGHKTADLIYGIGHIAKKPKLAEAIGRCIMSWSYVDWQMAVLLAALMKADSEASIAIFLTLRNARTRRDVLIAAADMTLAGPDREMFDAIMLNYGSLQSERADLAHGIFGTIPDGEDDEIPWIEAKNLSRVWIERFHKPQTGDSPAPKDQDEKLDQKRHSSVYKLADLERLESEIIQLWQVAFSFTLHLRMPGFDITKRQLEHACASSPLMVQALAQIRKTKD